MSLTVKEGETVGILGRNGSGKSTLLKCICGVLQPTSGEVAVRGKLAGLLELGAGFQQDLTGPGEHLPQRLAARDVQAEVDKVFDAIVDFSELEEFIDGPVKFYSSGMYVRLGFAVAVNVDPDVLVIDEVLAVGDERFQRKCIDRVKQFQKEGRTILLVTHSPDTVRTICDRGVVLSHGQLVAEGEPGEATRIFREGLMAEGAGMSVVDSGVRGRAGDAGMRRRRPLPDAERPVRFRSVHRVYSGDNALAYMRTGDDLTIRVEFEALHARSTTSCSRSRSATTMNNTIMRTDTSIIGRAIDAAPGTSVMHFGIVDMPAARRLLLVRPRHPEPQRHPLRLAGKRRRPSR